jgi:hypothetical protein
MIVARVHAELRANRIDFIFSLLIFRLASAWQPEDHSKHVRTFKQLSGWPSGVI